MKHSFLLLFLLLNATLSFSQDKVSVAGVPLGSTYEHAKEILENRFGKPKFTDYDDIYYEHIEVGGFLCEFVSFSFVKDSKRTYLNDVLLAGYKKTLREAESDVEYLYNILDDKYTLVPCDDSNDTPSVLFYFLGGENPLDKNKYLFNIYIRNNEIEKYPSISEDEYYCVLRYGPIDYIKPSDDF